MQFNKYLKGLILIVSFSVLVGCDTTNTEGGDDYQGGNQTIGNGTSVNGGWGGSAAQQLERLKQQNIVYFGFDKYDVSGEYEDILNAHANYLRNNPGSRIVIEGHADERGTPEYNIALGERRANAVQMYLQGKGVSSNQLSIVSYGKEKPAVLGHDEAAYSKNRRAVLVY